MPRIRTIKPEHWNDKQLSKIHLQAHLLWIGMWNFSDDAGVIEADPILIKSQIFPRRTDIRIEQVTSWLDQLVNARFILPFTYQNEGYYLHRTFKAHQRIDKPQKSKIPENIIEKVLESVENIEFQEHSKNDTGIIKEQSSLYSIVKEGKVKDDAKASLSTKLTDESKKLKDLKNEDKVLEEWLFLEKILNDETIDYNEKKRHLQKFIILKKPSFYEPYQVTWNVMAAENGFQKIDVFSDKRKGLLKTRLKEKSFDWMRILWCIPKNPVYNKPKSTEGWSITIDFVLGNSNNYVKIIEGTVGGERYDQMIEKQRIIWEQESKNNELQPQS